MENRKCRMAVHSARSRKWLAIAAGAVALAVSPSSRAATYSENFDSYTNGAITSQNAAWSGGNSTVVDSPGGADGHNKVLHVGDSEGDVSFPTPFTGQGTTTSFDLYQTTDQVRSLFFDEIKIQAPGDDGPFVAWGTNGVTNAAADTIASWDNQNHGFLVTSSYTWPVNTWQHVVVNANNTTSTFSMTIDGNQIFTNALYRGTLTETDGLAMSVWNTDTAYIDNFNVTDLIVPEPSSILLLAAIAPLQLRRFTRKS